MSSGQLPVDGGETRGALAPGDRLIADVTSWNQVPLQVVLDQGDNLLIRPNGEASGVVSVPAFVVVKLGESALTTSRDDLHALDALARMNPMERSEVLEQGMFTLLGHLRTQPWDREVIGFSSVYKNLVFPTYGSPERFDDELHRMRDARRGMGVRLRELLSGAWDIYLAGRE